MDLLGIRGAVHNLTDYSIPARSGHTLLLLKCPGSNAHHHFNRHVRIYGPGFMYCHSSGIARNYATVAVHFSAHQHGLEECRSSSTGSQGIALEYSKGSGISRSVCRLSHARRRFHTDGAIIANYRSLLGTILPVPNDWMLSFQQETKIVARHIGIDRERICQFATGVVVVAKKCHMCGGGRHFARHCKHQGHGRIGSRIQHAVVLQNITQHSHEWRFIIRCSRKQHEWSAERRLDKDLANQLVVPIHGFGAGFLA
mmetsp:Transcript_13559/g.37455  ORF Transcript_13559/g.37455 Transcript_13559/m.37455 type:complete len:256 (+) Transcript_13559:375-1142(+)